MNALPVIACIQRLRALVLPDNDVVIAMLSKHAPTVEIERDGDGLRAEIPIRLVARTLAREAALV